MSKTWNYCLKSLKETLSLKDFTLWVQPLKAIEKDFILTLVAPNPAILKQTTGRLKKDITKTVAKENKSIKINIVLSESQNINTTNIKTHCTPLFQEYTFDNLVFGNANQVAAAACRQIAENIKTSPYNPFIIYGESGLGKTHLMQAAGHLALEKNQNAKIIYLPLMDFVRNITTSLRHNTIEKIKEFYQSANLLLVDDIHLIAGKDKSQEEFFHIFNFLFTTKKQIICTCDQPPKNIKNLENRLKTRFAQGLNLKLESPELEMRAAILLKKSQQEKINLKLSEDLALFIATHIASNVRDLEGALLKLKAFVNFSKIKNNVVSKDIIETALSDLINPKKRILEINEIQKTVGKYYGINVSDLISSSRKKHLVRARQMAIFMCQKLTNLSLNKIGANFGNRDHSTILYSSEKVKNMINENAETKNDFENIEIKLTNL